MEAGEIESGKIGPLERVLCSLVMRSVFRIQVGASLFRIWSVDLEIPEERSLHLFDYLLYHKTGRGKPFNDWVKETKLLNP